MKKIPKHLHRWLPSRFLRWALLSGLVAALILWGPGGRSQSPVTISFLVRSLEADQLQPLVQEFERQNPDIRINIVRGPNASNTVEDLYTSSFLLGDSPYDLVFADIVWIPKFAAAGWLQDLSAWVSDEDLQDFLRTDIEAGQVENGLYRMPFRSDVGMLYYRQDLLADKGLAPPQTFQELIDHSKQLQAQGVVDWGYVWQGLQYEGLAAGFTEILHGYGGFWIDPETRDVGLDQPEAIAAVNFLQEVIKTGVSPAGVTSYLEEDTLRLFRNGNAAFLRNWPYVWPEVNQPNSAIRGKVGLKPMVHAPGHTSGACQGGWGFGMAATTAHPDAAWRVIDFFTSEASQRQFVLDYGYLPSRRSLFTDPQVLAKYDYYPQLLAVAETAVLRPPIGQYAQVSDILQRYLSAAITGQLSAENAMQQAAGETRRVLGQGSG
ncbi:ABC transporter substrate-binding protein [Candidatus Synechococcus calcipolaris G9]|uniref:ABC transporter substrate-binding protein n=1 Tax=Candidatus Synechococcus calcipolaris G9 TaxID=1497997 RepID=A0ABT6EVC1_9SYNE|nr:ABC transporter substrate-binding protein [Candidatus Synechococcus calcipolaris]MDG2989755.1 ABC transporter substrate-binding protein [Candidatus Synechococcus calcipolaris G9]